MNRKWVGSFLIILLLAFGVWLFFNSPFSTSQQTLPAEVRKDGTSILDIGNQEAGNRPVKTFSLTAQEKAWQISADKSVSAWTYNGTVPGEPLRVTEGDFVKVHLKNELSVPVTIHWHGVILPNQMDGVPGLTQDAVQPGESFTYEFMANDAGTYWYHSHQHSSKQVDKGLYGSLVIEEKEPAYQQDQTYILDEWAVNQDKQNTTNMGGMMMGSMSRDGEADTKQMYDTFTVNGKSGEAIDPLQLEAGETARLRFINAGYQQHRLVFPEGSMEVIAADGEKVVNEGPSSNMLEIAPGERIDVAFTKQREEAEIIGEDPQIKNAQDMRIPVVSGEEAESFAYNQLSVSSASSKETGTSSGSEDLLFKETPETDVSYHMDLSMGMDMGEGMSFQINNKVFPNTPLIPVSEGDVVKVRITNSGRLNHPMHLHGHRFQVASKNGEAYENPIVKDLINVKPDEEYTVYFKADNRGEWLFHCHDNNHADRGMITIVDYQSVYSPFKLDGEHNNQP
ncbi:Multicopper oxidase with three cupredoxin domains (includes cell division protein FtsP and spore coat protein CotA) [Halobacillus alkaliphilus]|uniref:Multicopper oxidase with three cupredoxin domains (Includes cell division protein FtsP and spore coat protein CotA) n=1 Tax=Halobacillus alkaliphilus TaxID=396056 RepID=A0A1I2K2K2_9BACI|nr:multicopper oxidase family protein [Halobacillus alkaliphilus]SFF59196.1 Multicopper oxidase with three cupredoxin domains (includes cell division protein FtsP and spore coat protein CotA) [Halobacillus alkaliphilus]